jgi:hypothetical protein
MLFISAYGMIKLLLNLKEHTLVGPVSHVYPQFPSYEWCISRKILYLIYDLQYSPRMWVGSRLCQKVHMPTHLRIVGMMAEYPDSR